MNVSVIIATYNGESFLREQLDSILNQSCPVSEVLVVDDGSLDSTVAILTEYSCHYPVIKLLVKKNSGVSSTFEFAIKNVSNNANLIFIADQDDIWSNNKVEKVLASAEASNWGLFYLGIHDGIVFSIVDKKKILRGQLFDSFKSTIGLENFVHGCCTFFSQGFRTLILNSLDLNLSIGYDEKLHLQAKILDCRYVLDEKLIEYRRHAKNLSPANYLSNEFSSFDHLSRLWSRIHKKPGYTWISVQLELVNKLHLSIMEFDGDLEKVRSLQSRLSSYKKLLSLRKRLRDVQLCRKPCILFMIIRNHDFSLKGLISDLLNI